MSDEISDWLAGSRILAERTCGKDDLTSERRDQGLEDVSATEIDEEASGG